MAGERTFRFRITAEGLSDLERSLKELGPAGEAAFERLAKASPQLQTALGRANEELDKTRNKLKQLGDNGAKAVLDQASAAAHGFASGLGPVGSALAALGPVGLAAAAALGVVGGAIVAGTAALEKEEQGFRRLNAVLAATGNAAGITAGEVRGLADEIQNSTMASGEAVVEAATRLAAFGGTGAAAFGDVLKRAQDMAAVFGGDVRTNSEQLAQALAKIDQGEVSSLRRSFGFLGAAALDAVEGLAKAGQTAQAQERFMAALQERVGGAGAAERGNSLTGAVKGLGDAWDDFLKALGQTDGAMHKAVDATRRGVRNMADAMAQEQTLGDGPLGDYRRLQRDLRLAEAGNDGQDTATRAKRIAAIRRELAAMETEPAFISQRRAEQSNAYDVALGAGVGGASADAERQRADREAREKATKVIIEGLQREIDLGRMAADERERATAADKARGELLKANPKATADEVAQVERLARERIAIGQAEKQRTEDRKRIVDALEREAALEREIWAAGEKLVEADNKREAALADYLTGLENEARLSGLSTKEREVQKALLEAQAKLQRELTEDEAKRLRQAVEGKQANEEAKKQAEASAREIERITGRSTDRIVDFAADAFDRMFDRQKGGWRELWDFAVSSARKALAQMAAEALVRPIVQPIVGSVVGSVMGGGASAGGGGGVGLGGGIGGAIQSVLSGGANLVPQAVGIGDWIGGGLSLAGNPLASMGYGVGSVLGFGSAGAQAALTGGLAAYDIGAIGGSALASGAALSPLAATGIGAAILVAGLVASQMFGPKKSVGPNANAIMGYTPDNQWVVSAAGADNGGDVNAIRAEGQRAADALNKLADSGVRFNRDWVGNYHIDTGLGGGARSAEEFVLRMANSGGLSGDGALGQILGKGGFKSAEDLQDAIGFGALYDALTTVQEPANAVADAMAELEKQLAEASEKAVRFGLDVAKLEQGFRDQFDADIQRQIDAIRNPLQAALDAFDLTAEARVETARKLGADLVKVEELNALERLRILQSGGASLNDWLQGQLLGPSSQLSGGARLSEAQSQFAAAVEAARNGTGGIGRVTELADVLTGLSRDLYGGSAQGAALTQMTRDQVASLGRALGLPGFATGGIVDGPTFAMLGEGAYRREAVVPLPDGRRIPVDLRGANDRETARILLAQGDELRALRADVAALREAVGTGVRDLKLVANAAMGRR